MRRFSVFSGFAGNGRWCAGLSWSRRFLRYMESRRWRRRCWGPAAGAGRRRGRLFLALAAICVWAACAAGRLQSCLSPYNGFAEVKKGRTMEIVAGARSPAEGEEVGTTSGICPAEGEEVGTTSGICPAEGEEVGTTCGIRPAGGEKEGGAYGFQFDWKKGKVTFFRIEQEVEPWAGGGWPSDNRESARGEVKKY